MEYDKAIEDYSLVIKLAPEYEIGYRNRASVYLQKKDYDRAVQDYGQAIRLEPAKASNFYDRARAFKA